ncbi:hypothetical protein BH18ACI4_BH18ACI4_06200 [soil metagenome]
MMSTYWVTESLCNDCLTPNGRRGENTTDGIICFKRTHFHPSETIFTCAFRDELVVSDTESLGQM